MLAEQSTPFKCRLRGAGGRRLDDGRGTPTPHRESRAGGVIDQMRSHPTSARNEAPYRFPHVILGETQSSDDDCSEGNQREGHGERNHRVRPRRGEDRERHPPKQCQKEARKVHGHRTSMLEVVPRVLTRGSGNPPGPVLDLSVAMGPVHH
eukprot:scaffold94411_cov28-Tisochrysis_lutea.AAC.1